MKAVPDRITGARKKESFEDISEDIEISLSIDLISNLKFEI